MPGFVDDAARVAFRDAIRAVEGVSQAEIVVSVRRQSARWIHANLAVGIAGAIAAHAYQLYGDTPFSVTGLFTGPILAGVLLGLASTLSLAVPRWLTPASWRRRAVATAGRATFVERGIRRTRAATGVLIYVSLVEQMAEVVADDGVAGAVPPDEWRNLCAVIDAAVARGGVATARAVAALGPTLAGALPARDDDINELPDDLDQEAP